MRSLRELLGRLALLSGGLLIALLLLEIVLQVFNPLGQRLRADLVVLPTNTRVVLAQTENPKLEREIVVTRNSLGFRGPDPGVDYERRLTIFAVGGSTTECRFLSDGKDWPAVLQRELQHSLDGVWLDNAGLDGHSSFGHEKLLEQRILGLHPKVVLFLVGINDVARDRLKYQDGALTDRPDLDWKARFVNWAARHSAVAALGQNAWRARQAERVPLIQPVLALESLPHDLSGRHGRAVARAHQMDFVPGYRERVSRLVRACRQAGIEPVLLTQPALYGPGIDDLTGVDLGTIEVDPHDGTSGFVAWATLEAYNDVLREVGRAEGVTVVDLARRLPKSSRLFYDFVHFTSAGAAEVAHLTAGDLCPLLSARYPEHAARPCVAVEVPR
jgi:lysophospholipase L1-like esterase